MGQENFEAMRKAMIVSQLRPTDVSDPRIINAMNHLAREDFVPTAQKNFAYSDRGVKLDEGRALNPPLTTGLLINAAELSSGDHVLVIGAATGYSTAVVAQIAKSVVAVEQSAKLVEKAKTLLADQANVQIEKAAFNEGFASAAPYDVILIDGAIEQVPETLVAQLKDGGRLVTAMVEGAVTRLALGRKGGDSLGFQYFADAGAVVLSGFEKAKNFTF